MPNSFLGFPVPKAKIAEMIEGYAPPLAHHERHEAGGDDEIDCTGLVGAGGGAGAGAVGIQQIPESTTPYNPSVTGTGAVTIDGEGLKIATGATAGSTALIARVLLLAVSPISWGDDRTIEAAVKFVASGSSTGLEYYGWGNYDFNTFIGFQVDDGVFQAVWGGGGSLSTYTIADWGAGAYLEGKYLKAVFTAGSKIEFYVNNTLVHTATTNLPTGTLYADTILSAKSYNKAVAQNKRIEVWQWAFAA